MSFRYSIKDLERISGIKAHTLRIWEQRYGILHPERTSTNIRYYGNADMKRLLNISFLNNNGYKISNIAKLGDAALLQEVEKFMGHFDKESHQVESLVLCLLDMDEARFESTVNKSIFHFGFESTMEKVIFPFLRNLGNLWQVGIISAAQEHYISNLIRQKIIVGIDKLVPAPNKHPKSYLFFLPGSELHEMGLLYAHYLAKARGNPCVYLGQSVPFDDLMSICEKVKPDCLLTILTVEMEEMPLSVFLKRCGDKLPGISFLLSGRSVLNAPGRPAMPSPTFRVFEDFAELRKLI